MPHETIKTYQGSDPGASQCLVTLEGFIGDMDNAELTDDSTVDTSDAVTAINGLIWSLEQKEAAIGQLIAALKPFAEVGQRFVSACASGAIPPGASLNRLRTEPLLASDLVAAANTYEPFAR